MGAQQSAHYRLVAAVARRDTNDLNDILSHEHPPTQLLVTPAAGVSPLHVAAQHENVDILRGIINIVGGADWDIRDSAGLSPLSRAVRCDNPGGIEVLLDAGADVNASHGKDHPACWSHVRYAAVAGNSKALEVLLKRGGDFKSWGQDGRRPIHLAVQAGNLECVKLLIRYDNQDEETEDDQYDPVRSVKKYVVRECTVTLNEESETSNGADTTAATVAPIPLSGGTTSSPDSTESSDESAESITTDEAIAAFRDILQQFVSAVRPALRTNRDRGAGLLHLACTHDHAHVLEYLLGIDYFKKDIEQMNDSGKSPIFIAIRHKSIDCLKLLVEHGAHVDACDIERWTPLHEAVKTGDENIAILKYLIDECKVQVGAVDDDGWTALHVAARFSSCKAVDILIDAGCDVNAMTEDKETPLLLASAQASSAPVLRSLLERGADLSLHCDTPLTPSRLILGRRDFEQLCILLDHIKKLPLETRKTIIDLESRSETGETLLHLCVSAANVEATKKLLLVIEKVNEKNHRGIAPLHLACASGSTELVNVLLEGGANTDVERGDGMKPLHIACDAGHTKVVSALLAGGADVSTTIESSERYTGFTPLMFAARLGNADVVRVLLDYNADMDVAKRDGFTALHLAALNGNTEICRLLVERGVDYQQADESGYFPMQLATRHNQYDVVNAFLESGIDPDSCARLELTSLHIAAFICDARLIWLLIRGGANVNARNADATTPLHVAAGREQGRVSMQLLLANGAELDPIDNEGDTPLHNACYKGYYQNARLLLRRGAANSPKNDSETTPLHLAAAVGSEETVEALVKYGADVEARNRDRQTPYRVASEQGHRRAMLSLFRAMSVSLHEIAPPETFQPSENISPSTSTESLLCVICQTSLTRGESTRTLPCGHTYHDECILAWLGGEWLLRNDSCPLCQRFVLPESTSPRRMSLQ